MSLLGKNWELINEGEGPIIEKLLENRGITSFQQLLEMDEMDFHDPYLFTDMEKAVQRIDHALQNNERIIVFGDYDVDGISAAAIVFNVLKSLGAQVSYRIPHRVNDGYGLSEKFIKDFEGLGIKLLITVDCGISCATVISKLKDGGIDTIITDHHAIPENFPDDALAVIHPKHDDCYPFDELTGSGIALKLAHALILKYLPEELCENTLEDLVDLASLGTVADMGPLTGENRLIVKRGLKKLANTRWAGLEMIMQNAGISKDSLNASSIGFGIAPRINAAGRIDDPYIPLTLLLQDDLSEKTRKLSEKLESLNVLRREMTTSACDQAESVFSEGDLPKILITQSADWHAGILGLIAGRLAEKNSRPAIIFQDFGDYLVGSARSPECFDITNALKSCSELIDTFGGHRQAAGLTIRKVNYEKFLEKISLFAETEIDETELTPNLKLDCEVRPEDLSEDLIEQIERLSPFGIGNHQPSFLLKNVEPLFIKQVGSDSSHLKFSIKSNGKNLGVIAFRMGEFAGQLKQAPKIDLAFQIEFKYWNGTRQLELRALDFKISQE